jgi:hypothetical protein
MPPTVPVRILEWLAGVINATIVGNVNVQPVPGQVFPVNDNGGALTVDGTVIVQDGGGSLTVDGAVTIPVPVPVTDNGGALTVDGTVTIQDGGNTITVDGAITATPTASELHLGDVSGTGIPIGLAVVRPANVTQYTAKDVVGVDLTITDASNASPIVITAASHFCGDGDPVFVSGVLVNTNANGFGYAKLSGYTGNTFGLYSDKALTTPKVGNGAYGGGGNIAKIHRLANFFREDGGTGYVTKIRVLTNLVTFLDQLKFHFYGSPINAILDNSPMTVLFTNMLTRLGACTLPALATEAAGSDCSYALGTPGDSQSNLPLFVKNIETPPAKDLYFTVETLGTGTPASGQIFYYEITNDAN